MSLQAEENRQTGLALPSGSSIDSFDGKPGIAPSYEGWRIENILNPIGYAYNWWKEKEGKEAEELPTNDYPFWPRISTLKKVVEEDVEKLPSTEAISKYVKGGVVGFIVIVAGIIALKVVL